jgi:signal transduction histidine kinase
MHRESVDIGALAQSCFNELKRETPRRNVRFKGLSGVTLHADPGLVQLLIENLIRNAWKFTSQKQEAVIEFGVQQKNGGQVYFVRDNGAGFDMAHAKKIFDPFVRLHTEQEFKGTGIGLAIVKRIVEKHGGTVWAEAEKDKGAAFYFNLE